MQTLAILPIKSFSEAKQRLGQELTPGERRALMQAMFCDVLVALRRAATIDRIVVVTTEHNAQRIAAGYGAEILDDDDRGHNSAATRGVQVALAAGAERALLVPGDCPALDPAELDALISRPVPSAGEGAAQSAGTRSALIVPDRHGTGTNALLLTPPDALRPSFGPDSCARHLAHARADGTDAEVVKVRSLALDIDTAEDLAVLHETLASTHGAAAHTRGLLGQLRRTTRR